MKDLSPEIRKITSKYGKEFIANDDFLDVLISKFPKKELGLEQKLFVYTVLQNEKVLSRLIRMQKKDIPEYIERETSFLSANYSLDEYIIRTVFKELLVGSGIAQEKKDIEDNDNKKTTTPKNPLRLRNRLSKSKNEMAINVKGTICCVLSIFWAVSCLFFMPLIPASMDYNFGLPGIIPSIIHYAVSVTPLLFVLTSIKQSQTLKSVAGGVLTCVVIFVGLFFSFGHFNNDYYSYMYELNSDMFYGPNNVGQLFSNNLSVIVVSLLVSLVIGLLAIYVFFLIKDEELSEIVKLLRLNKRIFLLSLAVSTILVITVGYLFLKYGIIERLVDFMGVFVANVSKWVMIVLIVLILFFVFA